MEDFSKLVKVDHFEASCSDTLIVSCKACPLTSARSSLVVNTDNSTHICCIKNDEMCRYFDKVVFDNGVVNILCDKLEESK